MCGTSRLGGGAIGAGHTAACTVACTASCAVARAVAHTAGAPPRKQSHVWDKNLVAATADLGKELVCVGDDDGSAEADEHIAVAKSPVDRDAIDAGVARRRQVYLGVADASTVSGAGLRRTPSRSPTAASKTPGK